MGQFDGQINKAWAAVERYAPADAVFLTIYNDLLGRSAENGGVTYGRMVEDFIVYNGTDTNVRPVCRLYQCVFSRKPDSSGLDYWVSSFKNALAQLGGNRKAALLALADAWTQSQEYINKYPPTMTTTGFVSSLYVNTLGRAPDYAGLMNWSNQIDSGTMTRAQVIVEFSESSEFINRTYVNINTMLRGAANDDPNAYVGNLF